MGTMSLTNPTFNSLNEIELAFVRVEKKIVFENRVYNLVNSIAEDATTKLIYRNEQERHNVIITLLDDEVIKVEAAYSIGKVDLNDLPTLSPEIEIRTVY